MTNIDSEMLHMHRLLRDLSADLICIHPAADGLGELDFKLEGLVGELIASRERIARLLPEDAVEWR